MAALDLLGRRWSLRVLWELRDGPVGARALRDRCDGMSPTVLYQRLSELSQAGLVTRTADQRYELTEVGRALGAALDPLNRWAHQWAKEIPSSGESRSSWQADDAAPDEATR